MNEEPETEITFDQMSVEQLEAILAWVTTDAQMTLAFAEELGGYVEARRRGEPVRWQA